MNHDTGAKRQPRLHPSDLNQEQKALYQAITGGPRSAGPQHFPLTDPDGALTGPFGGFLLSPTIGDALQQLGAAVRYSTQLTDRARELAILAVAGHWDSAFERSAHEAVGRACGLTDDELQAVRDGAAPHSLSVSELAVLRISQGLLAGDIDDETWAHCLPPLNVNTVFELTTLVGYYSTLALQMRVMRVDEARPI